MSIHYVDKQFIPHKIHCFIFCELLKFTFNQDSKHVISDLLKFYMLALTLEHIIEYFVFSEVLIIHLLMT